MIRSTLVTVALAVSLAGCGGTETDKPTDPRKADDAAELACQDFITGRRTAVTAAHRVEVARKTNRWAQTSKTNRIADTGRMLGNTAAAGGAAWTQASDAFAQACLDSGGIKGG
jgi:hypothetical protein